jgi:hypothetical protein
MAEPQYVRLPERLLSGNVTDVVGGSGWGLSGFDVKEVPDREDEPEAYAFVKEALRAGLLEAASTAEYNMVRKAHDEVAAIARSSMPENMGGPSQPSPWNEAAISNAAKKHTKKLVQARITDSHEAAEDDESRGTEGYAAMHKGQLKNELKNRGLDVSGNRDDLIARLEEDDQAKV